MKWKKRRGELAGWLFTAPATLGFLVFTIIPMLVSLYYSFCEFDGIKEPVFTGLENYTRLFDGTDPFFGSSVKATALYTVFGVPVFLTFSLFTAMLLEKARRGKSFFRTVLFIPAVIPAIAACLIWKWMCDPSLGIINNTLKWFGIYTDMRWFYSTKTVILTFILMWMWGCGTTMIVLLAGLQDVPRSLYDAMDVDGGGGVQKFIHVTLPMISPSILFCVIVSFVNAVQCFVPAYSVTNGGPGNHSLFYIFYMYREAFSFGNMGGACAIAWLLFLVLLIITQLMSKTMNRWVYYGGD
ncbi:MAG: sugar ABC transporter permease [Lachnospiraceae bacterium]|nr:sugar ABC transporter permease [Lachnospiraceae bacterium]